MPKFTYTLTKGIVSCQGTPLLRFDNNLDAGNWLIENGFEFIAHVGRIFGFRRKPQRVYSYTGPNGGSVMHPANERHFA